MRRFRHLAMSLLVPIVIGGCETVEEPQPQLENCSTTPLGCPSGSRNDFRNPFNPVIAGVPVLCTSAFTGQRVAFIPNAALNDVGRARPGNPPTIELNPNILAQLPEKLQLFWYGHECGHHVLGHTLGNFTLASESEADCWAIQTGKTQRLFTRREVEAFEPYFRNNPGSLWGHLPGPQRAALLLQCFDRG